jgi:hypothetical protein
MERSFATYLQGRYTAAHTESTELPMNADCCGPPRLHDENADLRLTYSYVLAAFLRVGRAPSTSEIALDLQLAEEAVLDNLRVLENRGAVRLEPESSSILDAYPYSAIPTKHAVQLPSGAVRHCMCAIDVFYVPFLIGTDVGVKSHCHFCDAPIQMSVVNGAISNVDPVSTVVWDSAAEYDCPLTNFFCSKDHLRLWRDSFPDEPGQQLDLTMALERGKVAAARIHRALTEPQTSDSGTIESECTITYPNCGTQKAEEMPTNACVFYYECTGCGTLLKPQPGDCCVFCTYGSVPCPPIQKNGECCS